MIDPAGTFEPHRRRLLGLAYRMLGSLAEAEDAVQETYLRWHSADREAVSDPRAFLITTTTRICLDALKSARARREQYVGPWLPDPIIDTAALAPDASTELAEDLTIALLLTLERLSPLERAAFLLHDVFDLSFAEIARTLDRTETACRQLAARARTHVRDAQPRSMETRDRSDAITRRHEQLVAAFVNAARQGDVDGLRNLLAHDVRLVSDGGGKVPAALNVIEGADKVATFLTGAVARGFPQGASVRFTTVNGLPGLIVEGPDGLIQTTALEFEGDLIRAMYAVRNPDKLRHLSPAGARSA